MKLLDFLLSFFRAPGAAVPVEPPSPEDPVKGDPAWLAMARKDLGLREVAGPASNPEIMRYWAACDYDPPDGDETAWCSAAVNYWTQQSGLPGTRQPNARSWEKWGAKLDKPKAGAVAVLWRGSPTSWSGHVALYVGPGDKPGTVKLLGGNQGNSVCIEDFSEKQVLSYRWPTTGGNSRTLKAQTIGLIGDGLTTASIGGKVVESLPDALALGTSVQSLAAYWPWFAIIGITISILARMITIYARVSDWKEKAV